MGNFSISVVYHFAYHIYMLELQWYNVYMYQYIALQ